MSRRLLIEVTLALLLSVACERAARADPPPEPRVEIVASDPELPPVETLPSAEPAAKDRHGRPPRWRTFAALTVAGGATGLRLLNLSFTGGQATVGVSVEASKHFSLLADVEYARAATPNGLVMNVGRFDVTPLLVLDRVRLGVGLDLTWLVLNRESGGADIGRAGFGVHALASVDLVRLGEHGGLFLSIKPSMALIGPTTLLAADVALGARF